MNEKLHDVIYYLMKLFNNLNETIICVKRWNHLIVHHFDLY